MRYGALIVAMYLTSTLGACAQPGPDGAPPGYGQGGYGQGGYGQGGYGQQGGQGAPPAYAQQGWAGGMQQQPGQQMQGQPMQGQPMQDQQMQGQQMQGGPGPGAYSPQANSGPEHTDMTARFRMANTTNDGRLTFAQAQAGGLPAVARNFQQIDRDQKGYVTLQDVREWRRTKRAQKMQGQGQAQGGQPQGGQPQGGQPQGGEGQPGGPYPPPNQGGQQY